MSLLPFAYIGSKRLDLKYFSKYIDNIDKIDYVVEPFGGSGYTSIFLFSKNNNIKSYINDIDENLINFYLECKRNLNDVIEGYNKMIENNEEMTKQQYLEHKNEYLKNNNISNTRKAILYLFFNKFKGPYPFSFPTGAKKHLKINLDKYKVFQEWLKNTEFTLLNYDKFYKNILEKIEENKKYFIFIDPPYLNSSNCEYKNYDKTTDVNNIIKDSTKMYIDILNYLNEIKNKNISLMLIINKSHLTEFLYKNYIVYEYTKSYNVSFYKTIHLVIKNT